MAGIIHLVAVSDDLPYTRPGNPSGHVMVSLAVLLSCAFYITVYMGWRQCLQNRKSEKEYILHINSNKRWREYANMKSELRQLMNLVVGAFSFLIATSRLLISSHFLHQVVLGIVVGLLVHTFTVHSSVFRLYMKLEHENTRSFLVTGLVLLFGAISSYYAMMLLGIDPMFSIPKALRHCSDPAWISLDTTPFYSLMRSSGSILGLSAASKFLPFSWIVLSRSKIDKVLGTLLSIGLIAVLNSVPVYAGSNVLFYCISLVKCILLPLLTASPEFVLMSRTGRRGVQF